MKLTIPIYIESSVATSGKPAEYEVRPLFHLEWRGRSPWLQKGINDLVRDVRERLIELGKQLRHEELAAWTFNPPLETERCEVRLEVGPQSANVKLLVVVMRAFERRGDEPARGRAEPRAFHPPGQGLRRRHAADAQGQPEFVFAPGLGRAQ